MSINIFAISLLVTMLESFIIAVQPLSDEKIHLQDVDGKIITNVPVEANRAFVPLAVQWSEDQDSDDENSNTVLDLVGTSIMTKQKLAINFVSDVSEDGRKLVLELDNLSEDPSIFLIRCDAPSQVQLDFETAEVTIHGITGLNEWLASIDENSTDQEVDMEVSFTDAGFYPIVCDLQRVG